MKFYIFVFFLKVLAVDYIQTPTGTIRVKYFPSKNESKGLVIGVQGRNEFIEMYNHVGNYFNKKNYSFLTFDLYGQGKSEGTRGHVNNFDDFTVQLREVVKKGECLGHQNIFLLGHSTGSLIISKYLLGENPIKKATLISPFFKAKMNSPLDRIVNFFSYFFSKTPFSHYQMYGNKKTKYRTNTITKHRHFFGIFGNHKLKCGPPTWTWFKEGLNAQSDLFQNLGNLNTPLKVITSNDDEIVDNQKTDEFCELVSLPDQLRIRMPGKHSLLIEKSHKKVLDHAYDFFKN